MHSKEEKLQAFERLLDIMDELRAKCPWDKKQTLESLRPLTIEETYELSEAILSGDLQEVKKELGDVLLHMVFYAKIAQEQQAFDIADALNALCEKLIERHPHIYGNTIVTTQEQVKQNWEKIKLKNGSKGVLKGVPKGLPSLVKAQRIQEKVAAIGFDWDDRAAVLLKVKEEIAELEHEIQTGDTSRAEKEFGDVLFSLVNYARFLGINPDNALSQTNQKFIHRFEMMETLAQEQGRELSQMSLPEMDDLWNQTKTRFP